MSTGWGLICPEYTEIKEGWMREGAGTDREIDKERRETDRARKSEREEWAE